MSDDIGYRLVFGGRSAGVEEPWGVVPGSRWGCGGGHHRDLKYIEMART